MKTIRLYINAALFGLALCCTGAFNSYGSVLVDQTPLDSSTLTKFLDPLPSPPVIRAYQRLNNGHVAPLSSAIRIKVSEFTQQVLPSDFTAGQYGGKSLLWGYNGSYPGPTILARRGVPTRVYIQNNLVHPLLQKYLTVDQTIHWADPLMQMGNRSPYTGPVPIVTHLHGGEVESASDGGPDSWFTPGFKLRGKGWVSPVLHYPNEQEATTLFYHDHALGVTRLNLYSGLAAFYLIKDPKHEPRNLPSGKYEVGLAIQDRRFDTQGQLYFPDQGLNPAEHPFWNPESFGDTIVVNGKVWPYLDVEQHRYRFRLVNGSNARFYNLALSNGASFWQIGTDGGLLDEPVKISSLLLAPGERADLILDFAMLPVGTKIVLTNDAPTPYPMGDPTDPNTTGQVMQFRVIKGMGHDHSFNPETSKELRKHNPIKRLSQLVTPQTPVRHLTLNENMGANGPLSVLLNNTKWSGTVTETPQVGATEVWEIVNTTMDTHPIHLHLVQFQLLSRQAYQADAYFEKYATSFPGGVYIPEFGPPPGGNPSVTPFLIGSEQGPDANEYGWKDTIRMNPGEVTRIAVRFAPQDTPLMISRHVGPGVNSYPFTPYLPQRSVDPLTGLLTGPGYVWHCHIVDHEDNEMMRPLTLRK